MFKINFLSRRVSNKFSTNFLTFLTLQVKDIYQLKSTKKNDPDVYDPAYHKDTIRKSTHLGSKPKYTYDISLNIISKNTFSILFYYSVYIL